jgi:hypothetical protein
MPFVHEPMISVEKALSADSVKWELIDKVLRRSRLAGEGTFKSCIDMADAFAGKPAPADSMKKGPEPAPERITAELPQVQLWASSG